MADEFFEVFKPKKAEEVEPEIELGSTPRVEPSRVEPEPRPAPVAVEPMPAERRFQQAVGLSRPATPADERTITFKFEEVVVFLIGALMLMVIAFLLGWYGHSRSSAPTGLSAAGPDAMVVPEPPDELGSEVARSPEPIKTEPRSKTPKVEAPSPAPAPGRVYSLLVIEYARGDLSVARIMQSKLESKGYAPVFIQTHNRKHGVYVGRFASKEDPRVDKWTKEIRRMGSAYKWCELKVIQ